VISGSQAGFVMASSGQEVARLNDQALRDFRDLPGVTAVVPEIGLRAGGTLRINQLRSWANMRGVDPNAVTQLGTEMHSGVLRLGSWQAVVGQRVLENFRDMRTNQPPAEPLDLQGQTVQLVLMKAGEDGLVQERVVRLRITGIMESKGGQNDYSLLLSINDVQDLNNWATGQRVNLRTEGYDQAVVKVASTGQVTEVESAITQMGFLSYSPQSILRSMNQLFLAIQLVLGGIGGVALLVAGFGIANAMVMAIYERTREIGLMKAVGARNREVMFIFLAEAGFIGVIGGMGGALLGWLVGLAAGTVSGAYLQSIAAQSGGSAEGLSSLVYTPWWLVVFAVLFSGLVGILSGLYPALRATRLDPVAALRYE